MQSGPLRIVWQGVSCTTHHFLFLAALLPVACAPDQEERTSDAPQPVSLALAANDIVLLEPLRFAGADGRDVLVDPGIHRVERHDGQTLRVAARPSGQVLLLRAAGSCSTEDLVSSQARIIAVGDLAAKRLVLWEPGRRQLRALGLPAGVRARGELPDAPVPLRAASLLAVTRPRYRDVWLTGGTGNVRWAQAAAAADPVSVALFTETGVFVKELAAASDAADRFAWTSVAAVPGRYVVYVGHGAAHDFSDVFSIAAPPDPREPDSGK